MSRPFLWLPYDFGTPEDKTRGGWVGPFFSEDLAGAHKEAYGPVKAIVVLVGGDEEMPTVANESYVMTPQEHIEYLKERM